jgi:predicted MPP superfamily phosphohydrolase
MIYDKMDLQTHKMRLRMKRLGIITILILLTFLLVACRSNGIKSSDYSNDDPFVVHLDQPELKILQITDLHMLFGFDYQDRRTFRLIQNLIEADVYDLIVITGDLTMSSFAPSLIFYLIEFMETLKTPWTFIFGNHETDFNTYQSIINKIPNDTEYLYFKTGPKLEDGGVGNFKITFMYQLEPFYHLYFLDSKGERTHYTKEEGKYDYLSIAQVDWYHTKVALDTRPSLAFMHTPLRQMMDPESYTGIFREKKVYAQGKDTGFFDAMIAIGKTEAVFFGHDHLNDFYTIVDGIMLAYGRVTGFNAYGDLERGGRVIRINQTGFYHTCLVLESEVGQCV